MFKTSCCLLNKSSALAWLGQGRLGKNGTLVLKSMGGSPQAEWSPCRDRTYTHTCTYPKSVRARCHRRSLPLCPPSLHIQYSKRTLIDRHWHGRTLARFISRVVCTSCCSWGVILRSHILVVNIIYYDWSGNSSPMMLKLSKLYCRRLLAS